MPLWVRVRVRLRMRRRRADEHEVGDAGESEREGEVDTSASILSMLPHALDAALAALCPTWPSTER